MKSTEKLAQLVDEAQSIYPRPEAHPTELMALNMIATAGPPLVATIGDNYELLDRCIDPVVELLLQLRSDADEAEEVVFEIAPGQPQLAQLTSGL